MNLLDLLGGGLAFLLTLIVLSYLIGDNPLFRLALHVFIGVTAGFAALMAINSVILPRLVAPIISGTREERALAIIPLLLGWLLLTNISPRLSNLGDLPVVFLVGVGAAAAIGGAITGTIFPQVAGSINLFDISSAQNLDTPLGLRLINGLIILTGTLVTLAYFQFGMWGPFTARQSDSGLFASIKKVAQVFIAIAFGFIFAGVYSSALTALIERMVFLVEFVKNLSGGT